MAAKLQIGQKTTRNQRNETMKKQLPLITVGEFKEQLKGIDDNMKLDFSSLDFYRLKRRSDTLIQVEFNQMVYRDDEGNVQVDNLE